MKVKHISLDVWNTLIRGNPQFAEARTRMLARIFVESEEFVTFQYRICKQLADEIALELGLAHSSTQMVSMLVDRITKHGTNTMPLGQGRYYCSLVQHEIEQLFRKYPPIVSADTILALKIARRRGFTVSIASNSNFISGAIMEPWLTKKLGIEFAFAVFSDQLGFAKPNYFFFQEVYDKASRQLEITDPNQIAHIGDDHDFDGGGKKLGFTTCILTPELQFRPLIENITGK